MHVPLVFVLIQLVATSMGGLQASEDDDFFGDSQVAINDLRVGYGLLPLSAKMETRSKTTPGYSNDGYFNYANRLSAMWMLPVGDLDHQGGGVLGMEFSANTYHQDASVSDPEIHYKAYALTLHPALGWLLAKRLHLEIGPFVGYGMSTVTAGSGHGDYWEYGGRLSFVYTIARHYQIGFQGLLMGTYGRQDFTYGTISDDLVIRTSGLAWQVQLGYRF